MIRVLIVAAYASVRAGLHVLIDGADALVIVGQASGSADLERLLLQAKPDVVLADDLPEDRERLLTLLAEAGVGLALLGEAWEGGARLLSAPLSGWAYLRKEAEGTEIAGALRAVAAGLVVLDPLFVPRFHPLVTTPTASRDNGEGDRALTAREREVLGLMALGLPNKQVAARLSISLHTVKFHVASILSKLGASSRTEAVTVGARRGDVSF